MKDLILAFLIFVVITCNYISYVPQIIRIIKTKSSEDLSILTWVVGMIGVTFNFIYSLIINRTELIIYATSDVILVLFTLILIIKYRKN